MSHDPSVCIIGAGPGGIAAGIMLLQKGLTRFTIFDKASGPGGTWYHNRYPGAACDVQSRLYSYSFKPNTTGRGSMPCSPRSSPICRRPRPNMACCRICRFNTGVTRLRWLDDSQAWEVTTDTGEVARFDVVISAVGLLNDPNWPRFPGMVSYKGRVMHTARWQDEDLSGKTVAVIGTGSSSAQIVKSIAPQAGHLRVFQRGARLGHSQRRPPDRAGRDGDAAGEPVARGASTAGSCSGSASSRPRS